MKKVLFIMTHLGSDWQKLVEFLRRDPRFDFIQTDTAYQHPEHLMGLTSRNHRRNNSAAIWSDVVLYNFAFTCWDLCPHCRFVYWVVPFDAEHSEYTSQAHPEMYYRYRLAGLKYSWKKTKGALLNPSLQDDSLLSAILG